MRIAMLAPPWLPVPPLGYGGTESVIDRLCRGLQAAGHEVVLMTTGDSTCPVPKDWELPAAATAEMGNAAVELRHVLHAYDAMSDVDVIHDHTLVGPVLAAERGDSRVVTTCHNPFDETLTPIYRAISGHVGVIAISHDQARRAHGVEVNAVIHHGIDLEHFPVGSGDGGYLLFLGRLSPDKGVHIAVQVARRTGLPLLVAAPCRSAAEKEYFEHAVAPLMGGEIEYVGEASGLDKVELLGGARALLNPIQWPEPFGLVMIEAMACGTPVIATPIGSVPEIVQHGTTGFIAASVEELAGRVAMLDDLDRDACRRDVEDRFSTARMVADHVALYTERAFGTTYCATEPKQVTVDLDRIGSEHPVECPAA